MSGQQWLPSQIQSTSRTCRYDAEVDCDGLCRLLLRTVTPAATPQARCDAIFAVLAAMSGQNVSDSKAPIDELWRLREEFPELTNTVAARIGTCLSGRWVLRGPEDVAVLAQRGAVQVR